MYLCFHRLYVGRIHAVGIFIIPFPHLSTSIQHFSSRSQLPLSFSHYFLSSTPGCEIFLFGLVRYLMDAFNTLLKVDGESFEIAMSSSQRNEYTAFLFYASWCPFSSIFQSKFSTLSYMYPQIKHLMVEQTSALPSVFSRYGIHSVPSLLIVNDTIRMRYHGQKDLHSLVNFYKRTTGLDPIMDMVEDASSNPDSHHKTSQLWNRASLKEMLLKEPILILSIVFVLSRAFLWFFPEIVSRIVAVCVTHILRLNLGILGDSKQLIGRVLQLFDVKRIWSKLKLCKTRNFHRRARDAQVWASSLASVSLGETSSSGPVFPSRDL